MRGATRVAVVDGVEIEGDWPRPLVPPDRPSDAARAVEAARAERATARGAALRASDLPLAHVDPRGGFVVVNKPSGVYVDDVHRALRDARGVGSFCVLAHRLDRDTSGCLVVALAAAENASLARAFREGRVVKDYLAHCCAVGVPLPDARADARDTDADDAARERGSPFERVMTGAAVTVRTGHGRGAAGLWRLYDVADADRTLPGRTGGARSPNRVKEAVTVLRRADDRRVPIGDDARAALRRRARFRRRRAERSDSTALRAGRTSLLVGDAKYGGRFHDDAARDDGFRLHACGVRFRTAEGEEVEAVADAPEWWRRSGGGDGVEYGDVAERRVRRTGVDGGAVGSIIGDSSGGDARDGR